MAAAVNGALPNPGETSTRRVKSRSRYIRVNVHHLIEYQSIDRYDFFVARRSTIPAEQVAARQRLIDAGIALFGRHGLPGTSTRDIARRAGTNIAGIAYHFGGKNQLYLACAEHIATTLRAGVAAGFAGSTSATAAPSTPAEELRSILTVIARFMLATPEIAAFARFVMREQMDPSPALDILYTTFMEPLHRRLCMLWAMATGGQADSERAKLKVFTLISQIFFFRLARAGALRRLGWSDIGDQEIKTIIGLFGESLDALIAAEIGEMKA